MRIQPDLDSPFFAFRVTHPPSEQPFACPLLGNTTLSVIETPVELSQSEWETWTRREMIAQAQAHNHTGAIALCDQLIQQNPDSAQNYNNRGLLYAQLKQYDLALADYNRALALQPDLAKIYNNRANCYAAMGHMPAAIADYETAIDLDPLDLAPQINLGITYRTLGDYRQALESLETALQIGQFVRLDQRKPSLIGQLYAEMARIHELAGDWNWAIADYQRAMRYSPDHTIR